MYHVCMVGIMVRGLAGPIWTLDGLSVWLQPHYSSHRKERGTCEDPIAQPSFGNGNSEEAGKAIPDTCERCLSWPLLSEALPLCFLSVCHGLW